MNEKLGRKLFGQLVLSLVNYKLGEEMKVMGNLGVEGGQRPWGFYSFVTYYLGADNVFCRVVLWEDGGKCIFVL